jgi:hypothetical protein
MLSDATIEQLATAVARGEITQEEATKMAREAVLAASPAITTPGTPAPPAHGKPWASLYQAPQITDRQVAESVLRREGLSEKQVYEALIEAAGNGYRDFQPQIKDAKAQAQAQAEATAEKRWLSETEDGRQERERRLTAEAEAILQAEADAKTRADAARVILEKREGLPSTDGLSDAEVTSAVFGESKPDLSNDLSANLAAAGETQNGGTQ